MGGKVGRRTLALTHIFVMMIKQEDSCAILRENITDYVCSILLST